MWLVLACGALLFGGHVCVGSCGFCGMTVHVPALLGFGVSV